MMLRRGRKENSLLPLIIGLLLIIAGLGTVAWLMWNEQKKLAAPQGQKLPQENEKKEEPITPSSLLKKLGLEEPKTDPAATPSGAKGKTLLSSFSFPWLSKLSKLVKKSEPEELHIATPVLSKLPEEFNQVSAKNDISKTMGMGTASLRLDQGLASAQQNKTGEAESDWALKYEELQRDRDALKEKFERLDALFKEKGEEFDKAEKALQNEIKNRKEFNKVKDLLEKELKEGKDKYRELEIKLASVQTESTSYLKRVNQLEEKIKSLEKTILEKEKEAKEFEGQIRGRQKLIAELEEKIKGQEKLLEEKNHKINEIVSHLKEGEKRGGEETPPPSPTEAVTTPPSIPTPAAVELPVEPPPPAPSQPSPAEAIADPEPPQETPEPPTTPVSQPEKPKEGNIILQAIEKGQTPPETPEPAAPSDPQSVPETSAAKSDENPSSNNTPILKLAPDILEQAKPPQQNDPAENTKNGTPPETPQTDPEPNKPNPS